LRTRADSETGAGSTSGACLKPGEPGVVCVSAANCAARRAASMKFDFGCASSEEAAVVGSSEAFEVAIRSAGVRNA
jgi:hypothetical protein